MMRARYALTTLVFAAASVARAPSVHAQSVDACAAAYEHAQELRRDAKLVDAREQLLVCASVSCPSVTTTDCARWLHEVDAATPSIVLSAHDGAGHDVFDVSVTLDGRTVASRLDGKPLTLDPGAHTLRCERPDGSVVNQPILVREGEKNRLVTVTYSPPPPPPGPAPVRRVSMAAYALGAVGVVALGTGVTLDAIASNDVSSLRSSCAPYCSQSALERARTRMIVGDATVGGGLLALAGAAWLWLHPATEPRAPGARLALGPGFTGIAGAF